MIILFIPVSIKSLIYSRATLTRLPTNLPCFLFSGCPHARELPMALPDTRHLVSPIYLATAPHIYRSYAFPFATELHHHLTSRTRDPESVSTRFSVDLTKLTTSVQVRLVDGTRYERCPIVFFLFRTNACPCLLPLSLWIVC